MHGSLYLLHFSMPSSKSIHLLSFLSFKPSHTLLFLYGLPKIYDHYICLPHSPLNHTANMIAPPTLSKNYVTHSMQPFLETLPSYIGYSNYFLQLLESFTPPNNSYPTVFSLLFHSLYTPYPVSLSHIPPSYPETDQAIFSYSPSQRIILKHATHIPILLPSPNLFNFINPSAT